MDFDAFVSDITRNGWNVFGVEVYEDGQLTHSFGDTEGNLHEIYSATKTLVSIAAGLASDEGKIDLQNSILDYLPAHKRAHLSAEQTSIFAPVTLHRLLSMSVPGFPFHPSGHSWLDSALSCSLKNPGKSNFAYSNIPAYLVGVALSEALCTDLGTYIEERIFKPLGIDRFAYSRCPEGYFYGASGLKLTVHELSQIGLLLYNKGVYAGRRIVSETYVERATSVQQMNREGGYGYFIWKYRDGFSINGKWKQKCYVLPAQHIMVTFLSHIESDDGSLIASMEKWILDDGRESGAVNASSGEVRSPRRTGKLRT